MPTSKERQAFLNCLKWADCQLCPYGAVSFLEQEPYRVFYKGNPDARVFILGEGPGANEVKYGRPFIGRAGKLLSDILEFAGIPRLDICIANTIVCSDDGKKKPTPTIMANCSHWRDLFQIVEPEIVVGLGGYAAQALLGEETPTIGALLGHELRYRELPCFIEYHPAYLLRNPAAKKEAAKRWKVIGEKYASI